jgi:hypothetical protein
VYTSKRSVALCLAPLLCALSAFPQAGVAFTDGVNSPGEALRLMHENQVLVVPGFNIREDSAERAATSAHEREMFDLVVPKPTAMLGNEPGEDSKKLPSVEKVQSTKPADFNRDIYYRNKLEFSLDGGWLPINIPFPLDIFVGDAYNTYPLKDTLVPIIVSLRWHLNGVGGPWILRGNWDLTCSGSVTVIPRGPESRYFAYIMGVRRNFVPRNSKIAPYFDVRLGLGNIDAQGPEGVPYAQGEDFTFTINMGSGVRYNFSPHYAISAGLNFMHISNLDLSQGSGKNGNWGIRNYGINVYGPMVGIDIQLRRHQRHAGQ